MTTTFQDELHEALTELGLTQVSFTYSDQSFQFPEGTDEDIQDYLINWYSTFNWKHWEKQNDEVLNIQVQVSIKDGQFHYTQDGAPELE